MRSTVRLMLVLLACAAVAITWSGSPDVQAPRTQTSATTAASTFDFDLDVVFAAGTCADYGFFEHNQKDKCESSCKKGKKCVKKERCGDGQCPDPGYCWKCSN